MKTRHAAAKAAMAILPHDMERNSRFRLCVSDNYRVKLQSLWETLSYFHNRNCFGSYITPLLNISLHSPTFTRIVYGELACVIKLTHGMKNIGLPWYRQKASFFPGQIITSMVYALINTVSVFSITRLDAVVTWIKGNKYALPTVEIQYTQLSSVTIFYFIRATLYMRLCSSGRSRKFHSIF